MAKKRNKPTSKQGAAAAKKRAAAAPAAPPASSDVTVKPAAAPKMRRDERLALERRARRRKSRLINVAVVAVVVLLVGGLAVRLVSQRRAGQRVIASLTQGSCRYDTESDPGRVNEHNDDPRFALNPPAGGVHLPSAASPGVFTAENRPPDGQVVHALEHGDIAISFRPGTSPEVVAELAGLAREREDDVLVLPAPDLPVPVAATAWHRRLLCESVEIDTLRRFRDAYRDQGPESPPET